MLNTGLARNYYHLVPGTDTATSPMLTATTPFEQIAAEGVTDAPVSS
jgi:hypothetical protein